MKRLTKEDILEGTRKRVSLQVKEYGREVIVRPLSDEEITHILSRISSSVADGDSSFTTSNSNSTSTSIPSTPSNSARVDLQKNFEALRLAVSMGMAEPQLTYEEVAKMKFGVPEFIGSYILQLSGVTSPEAAKKKGPK
jgi:hypothetical protein